MLFGGRINMIINDIYFVMAWVEHKKRTFPVKNYDYTSYVVFPTKPHGKKNHYFPNVKVKV